MPPGIKTTSRERTGWEGEGGKEDEDSFRRRKRDEAREKGMIIIMVPGWRQAGRQARARKSGDGMGELHLGKIGAGRHGAAAGRQKHWQQPRPCALVCVRR